MQHKVSRSAAASSSSSSRRTVCVAVAAAVAHRAATHSARPRSRKQVSVKCFTLGPTATAIGTRPSESLCAQQQRNRDFCVSWAGAGVFFFWQLGAMKYLAERYDLTKVTMVGASGGSFAAVLAACGVPADRVINHAYQMSLQYDIWSKSISLLGAWGPLIEQWLDDLLPDNAHELCRGRISVVVTTLPSWGQVGISDFTSKKDLINVCMASSHIPFALDGRLSRTCRDKQCIDGCAPDLLTGVNCDLLRYGPQADPSSQAVVFDYFDDPLLRHRWRLDMLEVKSYEEIRRMYALGHDYAARLHADGRFSAYELSALQLRGEHGHMSEVLVPEHSAHSVPARPAEDQPQQQQHQRPPMGLVLELQQDEQELAAGLQQRGRKQPQQLLQRTRRQGGGDNRH